MSTTTTTQVPAVRIELHRAEGPAGQMGTVTVTGPDCFTRAGAQLRHWSTTAPRDGSVDKTDFTVAFADGSTYSGCYGLVFADTGDLAQHIRDFVSWMADPANLVKIGDPAEDAAAYSTWLATYRLTD